MLLVSLVTMGIAAFAIGLLRNYSSTGIWAPILLLSPRIVQGLAEVLTRASKQVLLGGPCRQERLQPDRGIRTYCKRRNSSEIFQLEAPSWYARYAIGQRALLNN
jgi:hypothetical protein